MEHESLFAAVVAAGIPYNHHATDLYLPDIEQVRELIKQFPLHDLNKTTFHNQVEGGRWIDVPFAYLPGWPK